MRILIVQTSYLGDTILSTPVIAGVHQLYPAARLWMMTTPAGTGLVERDPLLEGVIAFDKRGEAAGIGGLVRMGRYLRGLRFDRAYALQRSYRTALILLMSKIPHRTGFQNARLPLVYHTRPIRRASDHDVLRNLALLTGEAPPSAFDTRLRLYPPPLTALGSDLRHLLKQGKPIALLVPGSAWPTKMWAWRHYRRVAGHFVNRGYAVALLGGPGDRPINRRVADGLAVSDLAGKTSVAEAMALVRQARIMICNDSMALHMASAFGIPCVAIFCATCPSFGFGPWQNPRAVVVEKKGLSCKPCARHGGKICPTGTRACMETLLPEEILAAADKVLTSP
ncbi:MAG: lipopolysaccharide heptosyltransferase II [Desulfobacterales bacterium]|jgi:heptosyltransferase-2